MERVSQYSDVFLAAFVVSVVGMMIIPLPTVLMDVMLTLNITLGMTILLVVLYVSDSLQLASFPSLLLIATLFRLSLNVSTTRLILLNADAGHVIEAFGRFVVQGNMLVGAIVFLILTLVNFIVISKGSERVAEVSARFTLDAMPGKQMAIDADLRAGAFDLQEAKARRRELSRESQLFGAMDGAMKFVKGDAIAGILITVVNIIGGVGVGVCLRGMEPVKALKVYGLLTIGDGLLSQIPALILSVAAGLMVTRVEPASGGDHLGKDISSQLLSHPKALLIVSGLLFFLGLVPGLPMFPFWCLAICTGAGGVCVSRSNVPGLSVSSHQAVKHPRNEMENLCVLPPPVAIALGRNVARLIDAAAPDSAFFTVTLPDLRQKIYLQSGVHVPGIQILADDPSIPDDVYVIRIMDAPVFSGRLAEDKALVDAADEKAFLIAGEAESAEASLGEPGMMVPVSHQKRMEEAGYRVFSGTQLFVWQIQKVLIRHADEFIGVQEVKWLCDDLEKLYPDTIAETIPRVVSYQRLSDILRRLIQERICIRDLKRIIEAVAEFADIEPDNVALTDRVRTRLGRQIQTQFADRGQVKVYLLDPDLETVFRSSIHVSGQERFLAMAPDTMDKVLSAFQKQLNPVTGGTGPVVMTVEHSIRYVLWRFLTQQIPGVSVLAAQEMPPGTRFMALGCITCSL